MKYLRQLFIASFCASSFVCVQPTIQEQGVGHRLSEFNLYHPNHFSESGTLDAVCQAVGDSIGEAIRDENLTAEDVAAILDSTEELESFTLETLEEVDISVVRDRFDQILKGMQLTFKDSELEKITAHFTEFDQVCAELLNAAHVMQWSLDELIKSLSKIAEFVLSIAMHGNYSENVYASYKVRKEIQKALSQLIFPLDTKSQVPAEFKSECCEAILSVLSKSIAHLRLQMNHDVYQRRVQYRQLGVGLGYFCLELPLLLFLVYYAQIDANKRHPRGILVGPMAFDGGKIIVGLIALLMLSHLVRQQLAHRIETRYAQPAHVLNNSRMGLEVLAAQIRGLAGQPRSG